MSTIQNDSDFRAALAALTVPQQRLVAARFVENVGTLTNDSRVKAAIHAARRADISAPELEVVYSAAKTAAIESYTHCGQQGDWMSQAGHFVAEAAATSVTPEPKAVNLAWDVAMRARMARTCATIAEGQGTENREAEQQYRILADFLSNKG